MDREDNFSAIGIAPFDKDMHVPFVAMALSLWHRASRVGDHGKMASNPAHHLRAARSSQKLLRRRVDARPLGWMREPAMTRPVVEA